MKKVAERTALSVAGVLLLASLLFFLVRMPAWSGATQADSAGIAVGSLGGSTRQTEGSTDPTGLARDLLPSKSPQRASAMIRGRCVLAGTITPLVGLRIRHAVYPRIDTERTWTLHESETGADGAFRIVLPEPENCAYELLLGGRTHCLKQGWVAQLESGQDLDLGTIELEPGTEVRGQIVDETGLPVTGASVLAPVNNVALSGCRALASVVTATSTEDGSFVLGPLVGGEYSLGLGGSWVEIVGGNRIVVPPAPSAPVSATIRVKRLPLLHVHVVDHDGRAIAGAVVRCAWRTNDGRKLGPFLQSDREGAADFDASPLAGVRSVEVWAWAAGFAIEHVAWPGTGAVTVVLRSGDAAFVCVRDALSKRPVQEFTLEHGPVSDVLPAEIARTRAMRIHAGDGRCRIEGIGGAHRILVRSEGYEAREIMVDASKRDGEIAVELQPSAELVISVDGLERDQDAGILQVVDGGGDPLRPTARVLGSGSVIDGRAIVRGLAAGACWIRPAGGWCAAFAKGPLVLVAGERRSVSLNVSRGCKILGHVVPVRGRGFVDALRLVRADGVVLPLPHGTETSFTIGEDGAFACPGVPPGEWHVEVAGVVRAWPGVDADAPRHQVKTWVRVETLRVGTQAGLAHDVDVGALLPGTVRGMLSGAEDGAMLRPIGQSWGVKWLGKPIALGPDGSFAAELAPGSYRWIVTLEKGAGARAMLLTQRVEVRPGAESVVDLAMPQLEEIELVFAEDLRSSLKGGAWIHYEAASDVRAGTCAPDADGTARIAVVSGEPFVVEAPPHGWLRAIEDGADAGVRRYRVGRR